MFNNIVQEYRSHTTISKGKTLLNIADYGHPWHDSPIDSQRAGMLMRPAPDIKTKPQKSPYL